MKKYTSLSFVFILFFILIGFKANLVSADYGCAVGNKYSTTTGQLCPPSSVLDCRPGDMFSSLTGQACSGNTTVSIGISSPVAQFNALYQSSFYIGLRGSSAVSALQQFLKDQGYYFGKIDGSYGRITARAVSDFKDDYNISAPISNPPTSIPCGISSYNSATGMTSTTGHDCPPTYNNTPVISGVSGPQSLNVNQQGTWSVGAYDAKAGSGNLTYSVLWGDEGVTNNDETMLRAIQSSRVQQSASFTHSYAQAGNYTPKFTVSNSYNQSATSSLSVNVGNVTLPPVSTSIHLLTPNGGETWAQGTAHAINWQSNKITRYNVSLIPQSGVAGTRMIAQDVYSVYGDPSGSYAWTIPNCSASVPCSSNFEIPTGLYKVEVCETGNNVCDQSDNYFSVVGSTTNPIGTLSLSQNSFNFSYTQGGTRTVPQSLTYTNTSSVPITYNISVPNQPTWLQTGYATGVSLTAYPGVATGLGAFADPATLNPGTYTTNIILTGNFVGSPLSIPVNATVYPSTTTSQCSLNVPTLNTNLSDNNTTWNFDVAITNANKPSNSAGWAANPFQGYVPVVTPYGTTYHYGNFYLSSGILHLTIHDQVNTSCALTIDIAPPNYNNPPAPTTTTVSTILNLPSSTAPQFVPVGNSNGVTNATKTTYNLTSTGGASTITELKFTASNPNSPTAVSVNGLTAPFLNGVAWLTGLNISVPNSGSGVNQDVFVSYPPVGPNGVPSGSTSNISLTYIKYTSNGVTSTVTPNISAPTMKLVASRPSITLSSSNAMLTSGLVDVGHVVVSADPAGNVVLKQLPIKLNLSSGLVTSLPITVRDENNNPYDAFAGSMVGGDLLINFNGNTSGYFLGAGTSKTFKIFLNFTSVPSNSTAVITLGSPSSLSWSDSTGTPFTTDNSTYFYNYPTNSVSVSN